jgi:hypothetical protein
MPNKLLFYLFTFSHSNFDILAKSVAELHHLMRSQLQPQEGKMKWLKGTCTYIKILKLNYVAPATVRKMIGSFHLWFLELRLISYSKKNDTAPSGSNSAKLSKKVARISNSV